MVNVINNIDNMIATFVCNDGTSTIIVNGDKIILTERESRYLNTLVAQRNYIKRMLNNNDNCIVSFINEITGKGS